MSAGWLGFCVSYNWPQFMFVIYDSVNGCQTVDFLNPAYAVLRWYSFAWTIFTYPLPLACAIALNGAAVVYLRSKTNIFGGDGDERHGLKGLETLAKRRAAAGLQRASIALALIFGVTSAPFQVLNAIQFITGI